MQPHDDEGTENQNPGNPSMDNNGQDWLRGEDVSMEIHEPDSSVRPEGGRYTGLIWLAGFALAMGLLTVLGPKIVEEYSYAYSRGQARAEYDVAKVALKEKPLDGISTMFEFVASKISPSVVHIDTTTRDLSRKDLLYLRDTKGQGSGVVYSSDGYIVTNQHVVSGAETIRVKLHDRSVYDASVIGIDSNTDLAVLKIEATSLVPGEWVEDHEVKVGTMAWAVGSPFGLDQSITSGIISGRHRRVKSSLFPSPADYVFKDLIQTDAAINPGNSGGPLVNANGQIMGINTSIIGLSYQGVCFAVPAKIVKKIADEIILQGFVNRGYLGVYPEMVSYEYAKKNGLADTSGAFVKSIAPKTPASKAGIRPGDVIRKWNQRIVESELTLFNLVANADEDSIVKLVIYRDGSELEKSVKIASRNKELRNGLLKRESSQSLEQHRHD